MSEATPSPKPDIRKMVREAVRSLLVEAPPDRNTVEVWHPSDEVGVTLRYDGGDRWDGVVVFCEEGLKPNVKWLTREELQSIATIAEEGEQDD